MQTFQLELPPELRSDIDFLKSEIKDLKENFQPKHPTQYLTRNEVAKMLHVDLSTVHNWTRKGRIKSYGIGGRVYFKRSEVETAIVELK